MLALSAKYLCFDSQIGQTKVYEIKSLLILCTKGASLKVRAELLIRVRIMCPIGLLDMATIASVSRHYKNPA